MEFKTKDISKLFIDIAALFITHKLLYNYSILVTTSESYDYIFRIFGFYDSDIFSSIFLKSTNTLPIVSLSKIKMCSYVKIIRSYMFILGHLWLYINMLPLYQYRFVLCQVFMRGSYEMSILHVCLSVSVNMCGWEPCNINEL